MHVLEILKKLNLSEENSGAGSGTEWLECRGAPLESVSPVDGRVMGRVVQASRADYDRIMERAVSAFQAWRQVPAPRRGQVVRRMGDAMRRYKQDLGTLLSLEVGKIRSEAEGEIQEMIDMADFAVGQSRMLYGVTLPSERSGHRMYEQWHPLGPIGVITAFNFPVAVWSWNAMIALVAGDTVVWKPSSKAPLTSLATMKIMGGVLKEENLPEGILNVVAGGGQDVGEWMASDSRLPLVSATGSVAMGRRVARAVSGRLGRSLLELGGNNAIIVTPEADLSLAVRAITFGAVGTAGQRCTTTRRVIVQRDIFSTLAEDLTSAYRKVRIGNPLDEGVLMGPLIDGEAVARMQEALEALKGQGGRVLYGGEILTGGIFDAGTYVKPALCQAPPSAPVVREETFAPILYLIPYDTLEEAVDIHNRVPQGLSSAIFTNNLREAEYFLSHRGSDCGIANVNIGTSGAEIGGAFGGEKDTGGGREAGSDAWKAYMRRQTTTINWSGDMPLAQGVRFEVE
ncbi:aldehyde dehydrogenase family protein [Desulforhabdus sp. TSK]|uniref:L-piperidine-6-carboxylate dehydrogenase n=1 Tax=Desulforhabdus sp. TSK TaxID=2925014 RepID=UPI002084F22F|nr:aldehyde dehydrogenase [Desulforhabdus sp. TSK]